MLKLFSADDHLVEHKTVWSDRLPAKYQEAGPRVIVAEDGFEHWTYEGILGEYPGRYGAPKSLRDKVRSNQAYDAVKQLDEMIPGSYDPAERAKDMISNGVLASVCFPSMPRFAGVLFNTFKDKELADLCVKAYNDYVIDEWCAGGPPGMFVPLIMGQLWDPKALAAEVTRCADRGARAITLPENTVPLGLPSYYSEEWDPVWRVCEERNVVVCLHIGTSGQIADPTPDSPEAAKTRITLMPGVGSQIALINLLFSPVCRKFPGLKFVLSESGIGWASYAVDRADLVWERYSAVQDLDELVPSQIFKRNFYLCQVEERIAPQIVQQLGADRVMWELDYPHKDSPWPFAQEHLEVVLRDAAISDKELDQITWTNACDVFNWKPASEDLLGDYRTEAQAQAEAKAAAG